MTYFTASRGVALVGAAAFLTSTASWAAGECLVTEDPVDSINPTFDIVALSAGTVDGNISSVVEFASPPSTAAGSSVRVIYDNSRYMEADLTIPALPLFGYGSYVDNGDGTVNFTEEGSAEGSVSGSMITITVPVDDFALKGTVSVEAQTAAPFITGLDTTDIALYTVGDSCASKNDYIGVHYSENEALRAAQNAADVSTGSAGSLGWVLLGLMGLAGQRRRR